MCPAQVMYYGIGDTEKGVKNAPHTFTRRLTLGTSYTGISDSCSGEYIPLIYIGLTVIILNITQRIFIYSYLPHMVSDDCLEDKRKRLYNGFTVTRPHSDDVTPYWMLVNSHRPKPLPR